LESRSCNDHLAGLVDREKLAIVRERMDHDDRVLARLDHLIEITDRADSGSGCKRSVHPDGLTTPNQIPAGEIAGGEIVVACNGDERPAQSPCHVIHEARLSTSRRTLEQHWKTAPVTPLEYLDLVAHGHVVRFRTRRGPNQGGDH